MANNNAIQRATKEILKAVGLAICTVYAIFGLIAMYRNNELPFQDHDKSTNVIVNKINPDKDKNVHVQEALLKRLNDLEAKNTNTTETKDTKDTTKRT
ncbi:hypothetical protein CWO85_01715 [Candidatus Phytoplasma ziziphi]|uniref:Uncharacterized protein n=1 Tax=Ziziphus jujuba witches'-broom phytoplasma TaxID=135727 RepID=A0A660HMH5_ZIZJU|nr:hypothetical protein [Candidatus Phytoplasma ziziphi]AYJ01240.1 hypothetical protein CWO85_01715 [Candidatus Phytoplasma ziziphi]